MYYISLVGSGFTAYVVFLFFSWNSLLTTNIALLSKISEADLRLAHKTKTLDVSGQVQISEADLRLAHKTKTLDVSGLIYFLLNTWG